MQMEETVKLEVVRIAKGTILGTILLYLAFALGHLAFPAMVPFGYQVVLAGAAGAAVAIGNFLGLAVTVQKIADDPDPAQAKQRMKVSYSRRMLLQAAWVAVAALLPCFDLIAGIVPLLFPRVTIFFLQITGRYHPKQKGGEV